MAKFTGSPAFLPPPRPIAGPARPIASERVVSADRPIHAEPPHPPNLAGLFPYQAEGVRWLHGRKRALVADEPGLGKTAQVLRSLPHGRGAIVVCPKSVRLNWARECLRFRPDFSVALPGATRHLRDALLDAYCGEDAAKQRGGAAAAARARRFVEAIESYEPGTLPAPRPNQVVIASYEGLPPLPEDRRQRWLVPVPLANATLVLDEVQRAKNRYADRTKKCRLLRNQVGRAIGLSGTPMDGKPEDLWGVLETLGLHRDVFGDYAGFLAAFGAKKQFFGGKFCGYVFADEAVGDVAAMLRPHMLRRLKSVVMSELPPKRYVDHLVECSEELYADLDALDAEWTALGRDALPPLELYSTVRAKLAEDRIPALVELVDKYEEQGEPVVVFSSHLEPLHQLTGMSDRGGKPREGWGVILGSTSEKDRDLFVSLFQTGMLRGLAVSTTAGGLGLTLTRASTCVFVDLDFTPSVNKQAEDRLQRIGQKARHVTIVRMVADHAVDRRIVEMLSGKETLIASALGDDREEG